MLYTIHVFSGQSDSGSRSDRPHGLRDACHGVERDALRFPPPERFWPTKPDGLARTCPILHGDHGGSLEQLARITRIPRDLARTEEELKQ